MNVNYKIPLYKIRIILLAFFLFLYWNFFTFYNFFSRMCNWISKRGSPWLSIVERSFSWLSIIPGYEKSNTASLYGWILIRSRNVEMVWSISSITGDIVCHLIIWFALFSHFSNMFFISSAFAMRWDFP